VKYSVLDLCPVPRGKQIADALGNSARLARLAESKGYTRYWLAEHHNMPGIASAATAVIIAHVAAATEKIRVGAGGIMLPNYSPLQVAEQFGTLETLFPGRIDLGLGRAPGTDPATSYAIRRDRGTDEGQFPADVAELLHYFKAAEPGQKVRAFPGEGLDIPVWILGSSLFGAQLAAAMGLPYAFASHFAPSYLTSALQIYRDNFQPSKMLQAPYVMAGFNIFAATSESEADYLASSSQQAFINLRSGNPGRLPKPKEGYLQRLRPADRSMLSQVLSCSAIGTADIIKEQITAFVSQTQVDELIVSGMIYDIDKRMQSFEIAADVLNTVSMHREKVSSA